MKKLPLKGRTVFNTAVIAVVIIAIVAIMFLGTTPYQYDLQIGDVSMYDISAPRDIADEAETMRRALVAMTQVPNVMIRSEEKSEASRVMISQFLDIVHENRNALYRPETPVVPETPNEDDPDAFSTVIPQRPDSHQIGIAVSSLISQVDQTLKMVVPAGDAETLMWMDDDRFKNFEALLKTESEAIISKALDVQDLRVSISESARRLEETMQFYKDDAAVIGRLLTLLLSPNVEYNEEATERARQAAYDRVMNDPVMVNRGVRIISQGDVITPESKAMLDKLNLTVGADFDWGRLGAIVGLVVIVTIVAILFFRRYAADVLLSTPRNLLALVLAVVLPLLVTAYLARDYPLTPPIYFASVVITAYFGFRTSLFLSTMMVILAMPMTAFDPAFPVVALIGCTVAALITRETSRQDNYARIILTTAVINAVSTLFVGMLEKESWGLIASHMTQATISGALSVIIAIGIMPLFELLFNTVSPLRLIELSQPGHPLMKRLFVEAPGTSQHSMMVANLADTAAEAIGANAMIARVGAYFHDIGKLEAPLMFTENQTGENPHDRLTPLESARIITRHPEDSLALGRKYRLPQPILRIANEHHGTTLLSYFWNKAAAEAEAKGEPPPSKDLFRYRTPIPSSRESAVVMLADSVEAALRSEGIQSLESAEAMIQRVIRIKIEQDQLKHSGLSFADIETITQSFLQIYSGHFHERISYGTKPVEETTAASETPSIYRKERDQDEDGPSA